MTQPPLCLSWVEIMSSWSQFPKLQFHWPLLLCSREHRFCCGNKFFPTDGTWIIRIKSGCHWLWFLPKSQRLPCTLVGLFICVLLTWGGGRERRSSHWDPQSSKWKNGSLWTGVFLALPQTFGICDRKGLPDHPVQPVPSESCMLFLNKNVAVLRGI